MAGWITIDEARDWWRDAPADDDYLQMLLDMAQQQVLDYGPQRIADAIAGISGIVQDGGLVVEPVPGEVPNNYRLAQLSQARNIWNGVKQDPAYQGIGDEPFAFAPVDLTPKVQKMIRPRRAKPVVV
jgi:hypothetical protein